MCGITGWFSTQQLEPDARESLGRMMDALGHRGPDADGQFVSLHAALGHTRLSIIDLESGQQPMTSSSGRSTIVFNGEIYNYESLRAVGEAAGYRFRTRSDTEVILALYESRGIEAMEQLRGMFAFALWDEQNGEGWLVRDGLGIKPLFYTHGQDGCLVFASEAKSIFASKLRNPSLDVKSLHLLMNFRYLPGNRSLFAGIEQLAPGHALHWTPEGRVRIESYVRPAQERETTTIAAIRDSVAHHMVSDVEVGAYLSGGIDSATIVALANGSTSTPIQTFTLNVGDDPLESRNAARTAELLGVVNHVGDAEPDSAAPLRRMLWHLEVPKINAYQIYELAGLASQNVKVCLSGLGGDELFLGYNAHGIMNKARIASGLLPQFLSSPTGGLLAGLLSRTASAPWSEKERAALMLESLGNWPRTYGLLRNVWDSPELRKLIYGPRLLDADLPDAFQVLEAAWPNVSDPVLAMAEFEAGNKLVNDLLWQEDRLSMAHSLEVRVPFVDKELRTHVGAMSRGQLMPRGRLKGHLRQAVGEILPQEILGRPKSGFQVDAADFYKQNLQRIASDVLSPERLRDAGLFNPEFVRRIEALPGRKRYRWHFFILYMMLMTHLWMEVFDTP
jgi:asparagine synthase (glutamine-hydrolysing)